MHFTFLGGAESIGASCAVLDLGDRRWVVDCGIRMRGTGAERLPDLTPLETAGAPTAILVTHAHLDHIGALPVLHQRFPHTPVYATAPTIALTRIQLLDSLRIMAEESSVDGELPLYSEATVASLLEVMHPVTPLRPFVPDVGLGVGSGTEAPQVTFFPAGHIIGACALGVESPAGRVFFSGDVSVDNQRTIPGMRAPRFRADVAIFESTYGNRIHPQRATEERRLVETVAETIAGGGKVLVPAFAIGRAQEVILVLLKAQLQKQLPEFPIHVDGMVRRTCDIYAGFPWFLQSTLRRRIEKHGDPFFGVLDTVRPVRDAAERTRILEGGPAVIVSSSGMLTGGPSPFYALALADDPTSRIAITGYQDEEAPGRQLLAYADGAAETITIEGREVRPRCRVSTYALSGHASGAQIASLAGALRPVDVFLVHGDAGARRDLAELFLRERIGRVHLPSHGEPFEVVPRRQRSRSPARRLRATGIGVAAGGVTASSDSSESIQFGDAESRVLAAHLRESYGEGASFTAEELYRVWYGTAPNEGEAEAFAERLRGSAHIAVHPVRLFQFVAAPEEDAEPDRGPENVQSILERLDREIPATELLKKSYQPGSTHLLLVFAFPDVATTRYADVLAKVFDSSDWTYEIHPVPNKAAVDREIRARLPDASRLVRDPSLRLEERAVTLLLDRPFAEAERSAWEAAAAEIRERTGCAVEYKVHRGTAAAKQTRDAEGRLEINLAYGRIRDAFRDEPQQPYRTGKKPAPSGEEPYIELAFISPEVGERYRSRLDELGRDLGWRLEISAVPNQNAILAAARGLLDDHPLRKGPSFRPAERKTTVQIAGHLEDAERERLEREFHEQTGYRLEISEG